MVKFEEEEEFDLSEPLSSTFNGKKEGRTEECVRDEEGGKHQEEQPNFGHSRYRGTTCKTAPLF